MDGCGHRAHDFVLGCVMQYPKPMTGNPEFEAGRLSRFMSSGRRAPETWSEADQFSWRMGWDYEHMIEEAIKEEA